MKLRRFFGLTVMVALMAACSPATPSAPPTTSAPASPAVPQDGQIQLHSLVENDPQRPVFASWPAIADHQALSDAVAVAVTNEVDDFTSSYAPAEAAPSLNIDGYVTVLDQRRAAVTVQTVLFAGASTGHDLYTLWEIDGIVVTSAELVEPTHRAALVALVREKARSNGVAVFDDADIEVEPEAALTSLLPTSQGWQVDVPSGVIGPESTSVVTVQLTTAEVQDWLSAAGRSAAGAARLAQADPEALPDGPESSAPEITAPATPSSPETTAPATPETSAAPSTQAPRTSSAPATRSTATPPPTTRAPATRPPATRAPASRPASTASVPPMGGAVDCRRLKCVALTFDDGPGPYTNQLLDTLEAKKAPATLFVVGKAISAYPTVIRRAHGMGLQLCNHTQTHPELRRLSLAEQRNQIERTAAAYAKVIPGGRMDCLRPPYGAYNPDTRKLGLSLILWDVDTEDWRNRNVAITTRNAVNAARPGSIILMHDIHKSSVTATAGIIDQLRAKGFTLVTVDQLVGGKTQPGRVYHSQRRSN